MGPISQTPKDSPQITSENKNKENSIALRALPDEILEMFFSKYSEGLEARPLANKRLNALLNLPSYLLNLKALLLCKKPLTLDESVQNPLAKMEYLSASKDEVAFVSEKIVYLENIKTLKLGEGTSAFFTKFIGDVLYSVSSTGVLKYYDKEQNKWIQIDRVHTNVGTTVASDDHRIAISSIDGKNILIYDALASENERIVRITDLSNSQNRTTQVVKSLSFNGDNLAVIYHYPSEFSLYDKKGEQLVVIPYLRFDLPSEIIGDDHQVVVFNVRHFSDKIFEIKAFDSSDAMKLKYTLGADSFDGKLDENCIQGIYLHEDRLYVFNNGTLRVFDTEGKPIGSFNNCTGAISFQKHFMALGVKLLNNTYAVQIWNKNKELIHQFPAKGFVDNVILEIGNRAQLTVGVKGGGVEIWNPEIEFASQIQKKISEVKKSSSGEGLSEIWRSTRDYFFGGR